MREFRRSRSVLPRRSAGLGDSHPGHSRAARTVVKAAPPEAVAPVESTVVNSGVYRDGERIASQPTLAEALSCLPDSQSMAWIGMYRPEDAQLYAAAQHFELHALAVRSDERRVGKEGVCKMRWLVLREY